MSRKYVINSPKSWTTRQNNTISFRSASTSRMIIVIDELYEKVWFINNTVWYTVTYIICLKIVLQTYYNAKCSLTTVIQKENQ